MSRYLVTGGLGVVGSRFAEAALEAGHDVAVLDAAEELRNAWIAEGLESRWRSRVKVVRSRMERFDLESFVHQFDVDFVLHAAASTGIPHSEKDPDDDWVSNVDATRNLLEALRRLRARGARVPRTVCLSSVKPYRTSEIPVDGVNEDVPLSPDEPYAASKMAMSGMCAAWARSFDLPVVCYRMSNLYGPAPCHGPRHGWLTWLCICAAIGRPFEVQGGGTVRRDMLFSDDINAAVLAGFEHMDALKGRIFNVGGGAHNVISVRDAAEFVRAMCPSLVLTSGPGRRFEDPLFFTDHGRFTEATGWEPSVSVRKGAADVVAWARANADALRELYRDAK